MFYLYQLHALHIHYVKAHAACRVGQVSHKNAPLCGSISTVSLYGCVSAFTAKKQVYPLPLSFEYQNLLVSETGNLAD
jgi:hypothetical protein